MLSVAIARQQPGGRAGGWESRVPGLLWAALTVGSARSREVPLVDEVRSLRSRCAVCGGRRDARAAGGVGDPAPAQRRGCDWPGARRSQLRRRASNDRPATQTSAGNGPGVGCAPLDVVQRACVRARRGGPMSWISSCARSAGRRRAGRCGRGDDARRACADAAVRAWDGRLAGAVALSDGLLCGVLRPVR